MYLLCHKKRSLIRSKRNEQGSKQTYLILLFSAPFSTQHQHKRRVTRGCGSCVQARQTPMGILYVSPRASTQHQRKRRVTRDCGSCAQARQAPMGILFVFPRALTMHEHKSTSPVAMDFAFRQGKPRWEYFVYLRELQRSTSTKDASPVAVDFAFRQGKPRWEYFVYFQGV